MLQRLQHLCYFLISGDLCHQPIGISDGQVKDISVDDYLIKKNKSDSVRFLTPFPKTGCNQVKDRVETQFRKAMTIKGIAFRSWSKINGMKMMYAFRNADPWVLIGKSVRGGNKPKKWRVCVVVIHLLQHFLSCIKCTTLTNPISDFLMTDTYNF